MPVAVRGSAAAGFTAVDACWVCGGAELRRYYESRMDFREFADQDPELAAYTGEHMWMRRCVRCGFGQPEALPILPGYFDRMYEQHWAPDWVEAESTATYKDLIFHGILRELARRAPAGRRRLLDVGAHAGRFMRLAQEAGWTVEGIELNPRTAAQAASYTRAPVYRINAHQLALDGRRYDAVVLTDVLEHVPAPLRLLTTLAALLEPGGVIAVKVPNGHAQWIKERALARVTSHRISLAENLVHVNQFSPASLQLALSRAGFERIRLCTGAPELPPVDGALSRAALGRLLRLGVFAAASLPGALHTPLALNLQAYATRLRS